MCVAIDAVLETANIVVPVSLVASGLVAHSVLADGRGVSVSSARSVVHAVSTWPPSLWAWSSLVGCVLVCVTALG